MDLLRIAGILCLVGSLPAAAADDLEAQIRQLSQQAEQLRREQRDPLRERIEQRRAALREQADTKDILAAIANAQKAYDELLAADEEILAARREAEAAEKALPEVLKARLAQDPNVAAIQQELEAARRRQQEIQKEEQDLRNAVLKLRERLRQTSPDILAARKAFQAAEKAYYDLPNTHPKFLAARQAIRDAQRALEERIKNLPEKKALDAAQQAYNELREKSPEILQALQARDAARKYYDEMTDHVLHTDPNGAAMLRRLDEIDEEDELIQAQQRGLAEDLARAREHAQKSDPAILAARRKYEQTRARYQEVLKKRAGAEAQHLADAKAALEKHLRAKAAMDPILLNLQDQLRKVEKQIEALHERRRELYRRHAERRRSGG